MKIIKNYLALIVCLLMLVPSMSVKISAKSSSSEAEIITIATVDNLRVFSHGIGTPEGPTVPEIPTNPKVPNTSTESLKEVWGILMVLSFVAVISIFVKARKEN